MKNEYALAKIYPATRTFSAGEEVELGQLDKTVILGSGVMEGCYQVETTHATRDGVHTDQREVPWFLLQKKGSRAAALTREAFAKPETLRYRTSASQISSIIFRVCRGVNFNPPYQRGLVWTNEQKQELIETILLRGNIGTLAFAYNENAKEDEPIYEVIDGKQRLTTLIEFHQDQFSYKGRFYSQLAASDRHLIDNSPVTVYDIENPTEEDILVLFLRVNRPGTPVDKDHILAVETRLAEIRR